MCGRYTLTADAELIQLAFSFLSVDGWTEPRYNIAPSQQVAVITDHDPQVLSFMQWGLVPSWAKDPKIGNRMINARSETAAEKPSFRRAFRSRRCLLPADGYYEWRKQGKKKTAMYIRHTGRDIFAFAGLWERWKKADGSWLNSCAILTTEANQKLRPLHHRMAVIIEPEDYKLWLAPRELLPAEWLPLMAGPTAEQLTFHAVSPQVNNPANDHPTLVKALESTSQRSLL
jgi:putative SOS response-associated peptidase YedK